MEANIQTFYNKDFNLRIVYDDNGQAWAVAKDIAEALEYSYWQSNIVANVPDIWKGIKRINTPGGEQEMLCLTENGVYFFLGRSDKPKALPYQMWIAGEVVPSIRKHGMYATPAKVEDILSNPDAFIKVLQAYKTEQEKCKVLEAKVEEDKPKVLFADAVDTSKESILISNLAKILRQNGVEIGQNRLFEWLRENGFLIKCKGERWNVPTQYSIERGLFEVKTRVINNPDGTTRIVRTTKVTGKGQIFFVNKFLNALHEKAVGANA